MERELDRDKGLPGYLHEERLMYSGLSRTENGGFFSVVVKGEWDEAEAWMKIEEGFGRITQ